MNALLLLIAIVDADPVADLKPILAKMEKTGTQERVTDFRAPGQWQRRQYKASDIKYDVKKTDSATAPYVATVSWIPMPRITKPLPIREEAAKAEMEPVKPGSVRWNATLAYQEGKWMVMDVWWTAEALNLEKRNSTLKDDRDPVKDWWLALGGK